VVLPGKVSINLYLSLLEICLFLEVSATHEICLFGSFCNSILLQLMKFAFLEVSAIHSISQRFATFCNVIATFAAISLIFATLLQPFLFIATFTLQLLAKCFKFANFIHCIYYAKVLPCNLLHGFNLRDTVVFIITEFFLKSITFKSTVVLIITESPVH